MRRTTETHALLLASVLVGASAYGCSLINSFGDPEDVGGTGGRDSNGGEGGEGAGGSNTGGSATGGTGSGGDGTGGSVVEPGLVVVGGLDEDNNDVFAAISPQTGDVLVSEELNVAAVGYEPERGVWFVAASDGALDARRFDRESDEWSSEGSLEDAVAAADANSLFVLNERVVVLDGSGELHVYDTSDLENIEEIESIAAPTGTRWGAIGTRGTVGGDLYFLRTDCTTDPCDVDLIRIAIAAGGSSTGTPVDIGDYATTGSGRGSLAFYAGAEEIVAVLPSADGLDAGTATVARFSKGSLNPQGTVDYPQTHKSQSVSAVDPCHGVAYVMSPINTFMAARPFDDAGAPISKDVKVNGNGFVYEPFTKSLLFIKPSSSDFGVFAWEVEGTETEPDLRQRITNWDVPPIKPRFIAVETPEDLDCD